MKVKFAPGSAFHSELEQRVMAYFAARGISPRDSVRMYAKTAFLLSWAVGSYLLLISSTVWWQMVPLAISLGLAATGIGFNIQHDANHGAYSRHRWVNGLLSMALDLLGGSSYVWRWKHNVLHHTYPNIAGMDDDIEARPFARLSPAQPRHGAHRLQHIYMWFLYGFLAVKWHLVDDFRQVATGRISGQKFPRPKGREALLLAGGKLGFFLLAFGIPALLHPIWTVLCGYAIVAFTIGLTMSVVFQLAHCVEDASFPEPVAGTRRMSDAWAVHQLATTVDFARTSRLTTWYMGGLNFQIEHHLFPRICHVHYPAIAPIVERVCAEHGVPYRAHPTVLAAIASHQRWLRRMGEPVTA